MKIMIKAITLITLILNVTLAFLTGVLTCWLIIAACFEKDIFLLNWISSLSLDDKELLLFALIINLTIFSFVYLFRWQISRFLDRL